MKPYNMGTLDLEHLKDAFTALVGSAEPSVLPTFFMWVDIKVAEYKCNGYMYSGHSNNYDNTWYADKYRNKSYGMSPDTTVQTEALELTKSPEKAKTEDVISARKSISPPQYSPEGAYNYSKKASVHQEIAYPKESPVYASHHSPVYGSEASGIINLSVKSSYHEPATSSDTASVASPAKLTLKVPTVYHAGSPAKPSLTPPPSSPSHNVKSEPKPADHYSSLRSLLEARKVAEVPTSQPQQLCASPMKGSDAESCASSPGPDVNLKDLKKTECPYCGKNFQYRSSFRRHLKIHQGVYTHICAACSRKFTRKEHFVRHKCNRKPNIPNRSATRVEMTPETMLPSSKLPQPKVAYPPTLDEQQISSLMASAEMTPPHYAPVSNAVSSSTEVYRHQHQSLPVMAPITIAPIADDQEMPKESRRKKAQPRKLVVEEEMTGESYMDDEDDLLQAYDSPVHTPASIVADQPSSPEDLSQDTASEYHAEDSYPLPVTQARSVSPVQYQAPSQSERMMSTSPCHQAHHDTSSSAGDTTISTNTGTYQIEQLADDACPEKCIKVTKQSNYLKLRKEAQMINGQLCFICPHCSKVFHRSSNFSRHMRIHRGVFSYICPACNRGFYRKEHFQKHKCARKSMSRIWSRKTKADLVGGATSSSDGEKENLSDTASLSDEGIEDGIDLGPDSYTEDDLSGEEGNLVVDESAMDEQEEEENANIPVAAEH